MKYLNLVFLFLLCFVAFCVALPNFFPNLNGKKLNLGLDLKGGSSIVLTADFNGYIKERLGFASEEMAHALHHEGIALKNKKVASDNIQITLAEAQDSERAAKIISKSRGFNVNIDDNILHINYQQNELIALQQSIIADSVQNLSRRIDDFGVKEAAVYPVGQSRIAIELPGVENPEELKSLIGRTAKLSFHLLAEEDELETITLKDVNGRKYRLQRKIVLTGESLDNVYAHFNKNSKGAIAFKFNSAGSRKFEKLTKENIGKVFAIVLDNVVLTAPVIQETIIGGRGEITGNFTIEDAREIAVLLKSGALPAKLEVVEQRIVGPSMGKESIEAAKKAAIFALALVIGFMIFAYRWYGVIASVALVFNLVFILAILTFIQATLTLPGIAGLILTVGMAVDTNVLIFERIKEEFDKTNIIKNSIFKGFEYAKSTIIDSNVTTLIAALIMLFVGSGPVKGFGVTLSIGIFSSMFTAIVIVYALIQFFFIKENTTNDSNR